MLVNKYKRLVLVTKLSMDGIKHESLESLMDENDVLQSLKWMSEMTFVKYYF